MQRNKVISADAAAQIVLDGDTVATGGFVGVGFAEELALALERRFEATGSPRDLTLVHAAGQGDGGTRGLDHIGADGMCAGSSVGTGGSYRASGCSRSTTASRRTAGRGT